MARFIAVQLAHSFVVLTILTVLVFVLARFLPGDAIFAAMAGSIDMFDPSIVEKVRIEYGLDKPIPVQFAIWLSGFVRGDWGISLGTGEDVLDMFLSRLPVTLELFIGATFWSFAIGIPVGIVGALKRNSKTDMILTTTSLFGVSIPSYWQSIILIYLFAIIIPIFPPSGYVPFSEDPLGNLQAMFLPTLVLGTNSAGLLARYVRSSLLEVMSQDFIRTARAKGLSRRSVVTVHALKPAMIPVVTVIGLSWGHLLAGAFFVEIIFALPGLGRMGLDAIFAKDFPVIQATLIAVSINVLAVNMLVDILYGYIDPRVRLR